MPKFAVAHISFFDNNLIVAIVDAPDWKAAIMQHPTLIKDKSGNDDISDCILDNLEDTRQKFFDCDQAIDVMKVK